MQGTAVCHFTFALNTLLTMRIFFFLLFTAAWACQSSLDTSVEKSLMISYPVALRENADEQSAEVEQLKSGDLVTELGEVSRFVASIYLDDSLFTEPWLLVQTASKKQGWVFAGALRLPKGNAQQQESWRLTKRFEAFFGRQISQDWQAWTRQPKPASDAAFATFLTEGLRLRDTINQLIARQVSRDAEQAPPNFFWLGQFSPYFLIQQIGGGTSYYLFLDYRKILQTALQTAGRQDDFFAQAGLAAFPADSIESALPGWVFPLSLEESASNLGMGKHLNSLKVFDQAWQSGPYFQAELRRMTELLLADILDKSRTYWQPKEKILAELKQLKNSPLTCLTDRDRLALEARYKMFETPEKNGLILNLRSGK